MRCWGMSFELDDGPPEGKVDCLSLSRVNAPMGIFPGDPLLSILSECTANGERTCWHCDIHQWSWPPTRIGEAYKCVCVGEGRLSGMSQIHTEYISLEDHKLCGSRVVESPAASVGLRRGPGLSLAAWPPGPNSTA